MIPYIAVINVAVSENASIGYIVGVISASDPDGPSDGEVFYEFEGNSSSVKFTTSLLAL